MANYVLEFLDPFGQSLFDHRVELEDIDGIDGLTGLMHETGSDTEETSVRRVIEGGHDPRAKYSVRITKKEEN